MRACECSGFPLLGHGYHYILLLLTCLLFLSTIDSSKGMCCTKNDIPVVEGDDQNSQYVPRDT